MLQLDQRAKPNAEHLWFDDTECQAAENLPGLDHTQLSFYHNGTEYLLTDVRGHVIKGILA